MENTKDGAAKSAHAPADAQVAQVAGPGHEALVQGLRDIIDEAPVSEKEIDSAAAEMKPFLSAAGRAEMQFRLDQGDLMSLRLAVLGGLSAATLLRMASGPMTIEGLTWERWLNAVLEAVGISSIEEDTLRQLAFDAMICSLSDADTLEVQTEDGVEDALPPLSLPHLRLLQTQGRNFAGVW